MAVWFSGIGFASWKLLEPFRGPLVVSPRSSVHRRGPHEPCEGKWPASRRPQTGGAEAAPPPRPGCQRALPLLPQLPRPPRRLLSALGAARWVS